MRTYECDGLTGRRAVPQAVVLPRTTAEVRAAVRVCHATRHPVRRPRSRHRPLRRRGAGCRGDRDRPGAHEPHPRGRRAQPAGAGAAGRRQPGRHPGGGAARPLLRPRPVEPAGVHDRRQRRRELRRRALPQVRLHHQPRARARGRAGRRSRSCRIDRAGELDLLGGFVGSEGTLGIATEVVVSVLPPARSGSRRCWRRSSPPTRPARSSRRSSPPGSCPRRSR